MNNSGPVHKNNPKVSVSLITYNHTNYIEQAINSVLMQETDFDFELIIGEDDSTDGTRDIVLSYKARYPESIKVLLNEREQVIFIDGKPTGRWNLINNLRHCSGKYIALLEGDDYWTDPKKLQKQVDFLENNPEYSMCFHKVIFLSENNVFDPTIYEPYKKKSSYTLEDLIQKNFIATLSVLYRKYDYFSALPEWYYAFPVGDYPLHLLAAEQGKIGYIDDQMGVRRVQEGGFWSSMSKEEKYETDLKISDMIFGYFDGSECSRAARAGLFHAQYRLDYSRKKYFSSLKNMLKCLWLVPDHIAIHDRGLLKSILDIFIPGRILTKIGQVYKKKTI